MRVRATIQAVFVTLILGAPPLARADVEEKCAWTGSTTEPTSNQVMMTPIVADMNADDIPDVVFISFVTDINAGQESILRVISGADCSELYTVVDVGVQTCVDGTSMRLNERGDIGFLVPGAGGRGWPSETSTATVYRRSWPTRRARSSAVFQSDTGPEDPTRNGSQILVRLVRVGELRSGAEIASCRIEFARRK